MSSYPPPLFPEDDPGVSDIELAARAQLDRLQAAGVLTEDHTILRHSILTLAHSMGVSARRGQSVALAHASKELREWYLLIPEPPAEDDPFWAVVRDASAAKG